MPSWASQACPIEKHHAGEDFRLEVNVEFTVSAHGVTTTVFGIAISSPEHSSDTTTALLGGGLTQYVNHETLRSLQ